MANKILIKRSLNTANATGLANGELAYSSNGDVLFIGANGAVSAIGGKRTPGTLTANQSIVVNANGFVNKVKTNELVIGADGSTANITSVILSSTLSGASNTDLASAWAIKNYIDTQAGSSTLGGLSDVTISSPANNNLLIYDADAAQWENHTISGTSNEVEVTFSGQDITVGLPANVQIADNLSGNTLTVTGTTVSSNTTTGAVTIAGGLGVAGRINTLSIAAGNDSVYSTANGTAVTTGNVFATGTVNANALTVGGWVIANTGGIYTSGVVNGDIIQVGSAFKANTTQVTIRNDVAVSANGSVGTTGQVLTSNGSTVYWSTITADITDVTAGNGLSGGGSSGNVTLNVNANNGIIANSSGVFAAAANGISVTSAGINVVAGTGVTSNSSGVHIGQAVGTTDNVTFNDVTINGNTTLGSSSGDVVTYNGRVNSDIVPSANVTYDLGTNLLRWNEIHASNVHSTVGYFEQNVEIGGDLIVTGNLVTVNVSSVVVSDPLMYLAGNNYVSDLVDIGFVGNYNDSITDRHTGVVRHAATDQYYIFKNYTPEPNTNVIDITHASFKLADVNAYLISGGLVSNATHVAITANASVNVSITANSLTLTAPLAATSGGTGQNTYSSGDILVANTGNALSKLSLGADGLVLQSNGSALIYADLDGGTF